MLVLMRLMSRTYAIMKYALLSDWKYECKDPTSVIHEQQQEQSFSFVIAASPNPAEVVVGLRFVGCVRTRTGPQCVNSTIAQRKNTTSRSEMGAKWRIVETIKRKKALTSRWTRLAA